MDKLPSGEAHGADFKRNGQVYHAGRADHGIALRPYSYCQPIGTGVLSPLWVCHRSKTMGEKTDVWQGTLALMVLKTLQMIGPQHGYGLARRIEQTSGDVLALNYGTLYPALLKLEQEGYIRSRWGTSENNRRAKFYELTKAGERYLRKAAREWELTTEIVARFLSPAREA